jgi:hypothetical protein
VSLSSFYFLLPFFLFLLLIFLHLFLSRRRRLGEEMLCISQVSLEALKKRHAQGWLHEMESDLNQVMLRIREARRTKQVGYRRQHCTRFKQVCQRVTGIKMSEVTELLTTVGKIWIMLPATETGWRHRWDRQQHKQRSNKI